MNTIHIQHFKTLYGELMLGAFEEQLCLCDWRYRRMRESIDLRVTRGLDARYVEAVHPVITQAISELEEYFEGDRDTFEVPLLTVGTDFQKQVWDELLKIPYGQVVTYAQLATRINKPDALRAVGTANGANALSIFIPCHRIQGSNGALVGYAGGLRAKEKLLALESNVQSDLFARF